MENRMPNTCLMLLHQLTPNCPKQSNIIYQDNTTIQSTVIISTKQKLRGLAMWLGRTASQSNEYACLLPSPDCRSYGSTSFTRWQHLSKHPPPGAQQIREARPWAHACGNVCVLACAWEDGAVVSEDLAGSGVQADAILGHNYYSGYCPKYSMQSHNESVV